MVRAVEIHKTGPPDVLKLTNDYKKPKIVSGQVLIRQISTSVNPVDYKVRSGRAEKLPKVLGGDAAGIIAESLSSKWKEGDRVFALTPGFRWDTDEYGSYAEYTASHEDWLALVPSTLALDIAGGVPLVALTAFQALESGGLQPGKGRVLVHAGAGGVGHFAIQLAKAHWKAFVVTTGSTKNQEFLKELGADEVVDYQTEDFAAKYKDKPFDLVIDAVGGDVEDRSYTVLTETGTYLHIFSTHTDPKKIEAGKAWTGRKYETTLVVPNGEQLQIVAGYLEQGSVKLVVDKIFPLEQIREAHEYAENKQGRGKIVVQISKE
ncbi:putative zinc-binding dehydrogenase [Coccomyxa subellipsoidea C-169]|uniref:Zinc-binding dehydrogenase n=1 Tax=Coccomyxa subellipsoidea (strain C-169) TaxID=574566 RepID=I0YLA2_COCSC|nr:putative zinc-binding dehydrogenase [Coccomyxa subellipsoidea C-169]EIE19171.1 putative zinc-binding dehydrogenase [Coccomyxa subellipsoidea C-169]|eukprot:XP_005643715.1 putative zinc-binding dehydrogenase [Coccomyxa subellipsoidea C-169]